MISCLAKAYESLGLTPPSTILTDKEDALINVIEEISPDTKNMPGIWHIIMNILKNFRKIIEDIIIQIY
jgi:hypothetical protein